MDNKLKLINSMFQGNTIRTACINEGEYYLSIVDVIAVLTDSPNPRNYWNMLKRKMKDEESEVVTNSVQLKLVAPDGKMRLTDTFSVEDTLRIIETVSNSSHLNK